MSKSCSCPISSRRVTWPPNSAASAREIRSRFGAADPSDCSPSKAVFCLAPNGSSAIDRFPERLKMARDQAGAEALNYEEVEFREALNEMTGGRRSRPLHRRRRFRRPIFAELPRLYDVVKTKLMLETDPLSFASTSDPRCRPGGTVLRPGRLRGFHRQVSHRRNR